MWYIIERFCESEKCAVSFGTTITNKVKVVRERAFPQKHCCNIVITWVPIIVGSSRMWIRIFESHKSNLRRNIAVWVAELVTHTDGRRKNEVGHPLSLTLFFSINALLEVSIPLPAVIVCSGSEHSRTYRLYENSGGALLPSPPNQTFFVSFTLICSLYSRQYADMNEVIPWMTGCCVNPINIAFSTSLKSVSGASEEDIFTQGIAVYPRWLEAAKRGHSEKNHVSVVSLVPVRGLSSIYTHSLFLPVKGGVHGCRWHRYASIMIVSFRSPATLVVYLGRRTDLTFLVGFTAIGTYPFSPTPRRIGRSSKMTGMPINIPVSLVYTRCHKKQKNGSFCALIIRCVI